MNIYGVNAVNRFLFDLAYTSPKPVVVKVVIE